MSYYLQKAREVTWAELRDELSLMLDQWAGGIWGAPIDHDEAHPWSEDNHVAFVDRRRVTRARLPDINSFLLLDALLRRALRSPPDPRTEAEVAQFGAGGLCGWWKDEVLRTGRRLFRGRRPLRLDFDVDSASWGAKYRRHTLDDDILKRFLSKDSLPRRFHGLAADLGVDHRFILRTWARPAWHKWDCDLICMANAISALRDPLTETQQHVFEQNQRLINGLIPEHCRSLMMYYEPKVYGVFLLLFYDREHRRFLTDDARAHLVDLLRSEREALAGPELRSRWAGDDSLTYLHGFNLVWNNRTIPPLSSIYADRYLLAASQLRCLPG
jgi:hypothetical protein